jgi:hypothetical protein
MIDLNTAVSGMQQIREGGSKVSSKGAPSSGGVEGERTHDEDHVPGSS